MRTYKILSIVFIVVCAVLLAGIFVSRDFFPVGQKVIFAVCLCVVIVLMGVNLRMISKKQK